MRPLRREWLRIWTLGAALTTAAGCGGEGLIAVHSVNSGVLSSQEVYLVEADVGFGRRLTCNSLVDFAATVSANADRVSYLRANSLNASLFALIQTSTDFEGSCPVAPPPVLAVQGPGTPNLAYSPVINTRLALTADSIAGFTLRTLSDDGSADSVLVTAGANQSFRRPKWSPDGAFIAVERLTRGPGCALSSFTNINILIVDAVTGVVVRTIGDATFNAFDAAWSPASTRLAFTGALLVPDICRAIPTDASDAFDVYVINVPGVGAPTQISPLGPGNSRGPAFLSGGTSIAYIGQPDPNVNAGRALYSMAANGQGAPTLIKEFDDQVNLGPLLPPKGPAPFASANVIVHIDKGVGADPDLRIVEPGGGNDQGLFVHPTLDTYEPYFTFTP